MGKIILESSIINDEYTQYVYDKFDIQDSEKTITEIEYNLANGKDKEWNIGLIYGSSGSGKSTILNKLGKPKKVLFDDEKALISNFNFLEPEEASLLLSSMGLSSVPSWLRPFKNLSNGEKYRAELAYIVGSSNDNEVILIDEYTSLVDRDVAKAMSFALQKYIRKTNKRIILASCHYDILDWLLPDWISSPQKNSGVLEWCSHRRQRPNIELQISRVTSDTWDIFKKHHYLTEDVNKSCKFLLFSWNDRPVGINAVISQPSGYFKNGVRESRLVVLPDFQGLGLGSYISNITASMFTSEGYRYFTKTIHPALGKYRNNDDMNWRPTRKNGQKESSQTPMGGEYGNWKVLKRTSYCHEYIGEPLEGYGDLIKSINDLRDKKKK